MYRVTYMVLAVYSGLLYFVYIPTIKYLIKEGLYSNKKIRSFTLLIWLPWLLKPLFGYLCDFYPICNKRITSYVAIAGCSVILALLVAQRLKLEPDSYVLLGIVLVMFTCFGMIDAAARTIELL